MTRHTHPGDSFHPTPGAGPTLPPGSHRFAGAFTAIVTPFTADGSGIDFGRLAEQIEFQARESKGGVRGIIIAGTTGESPALSDAEYRQLAARATDLARRHGLLAVVGTGSNCTRHACELQRLAASVGADATLSVNPYYNKPTQEGLFAHFSAQADAADVPMILYNIPGRTGVALTPDTVVRLAAHPRVVGIKDATGSTEVCGEVAARCPHLAVLSGDDGMTLPFMAVGAVGVVSVVSNVLPGLIGSLVAAGLRGDGRAALELHRRLMPVARAMFVETNPIPVKAAMRLAGRDSGALRLPMTEASPATVRLLESLGLASARTVAVG